jgi:tetraacyldisaccharide 4'-kinase
MLTLYNFWKNKNIFNYLLLPISFFYSILGKLHYALKKPKVVTAKVICIGNVVVGGAGKTPIVIALAEELKKKGYKVALISRGYKGTISHNKRAVKVNIANHSALLAGDEAILLSQCAPTYICKNRYIAAKYAEDDGAEVIIMDDGLQNNTLKKDLTIMVIDSDFVFGNGLIFPAGPLRESLSSAYKKVDLFCINKNTASNKNLTDIYNHKPVFTVKTKVSNDSKVRKKKFVCLVGISNPKKFIDTLRALNINVVQSFCFPDHYFFSDKDLKKVIEVAQKHKCKIITTAKDIVRIPNIYHQYFHVLEIKKLIPKQMLKKVLEVIG